MNVLSLFDGIGCGRVALERTNIPINSYMASEIDKDAIKVAISNYPDIQELGDVKSINSKDLPKIDLLLGGSPCQGFSCSGKMLNFQDPRSKLFFEYVRILDEINPKYFLLENVKMKEEWKDIITSYLGVPPILINSSLVSAQNRERLYWTNIPNISSPEDRHIVLTDILEDLNFTNPGAIRGRKLNGATKSIQCLEVKKDQIKSNCLTTVKKDNVLTTLTPGRYPNAFSDELPFRYYTIKEYCRLQTLPDDYVSSVSESKGFKLLGNGWTVDVIAHILSYIK